MVQLSIDDEYANQVDTAAIELAARMVLDHQAIPPDIELTIVITNDEHIRRLNLQYRNANAPTDVLSFPADFIDPDSHRHYLGDIVISYPLSIEQAKIAGHTTLTELQLLVVHGILHLLGYDHNEPEEKTLMWTIQEQILNQLGYSEIEMPD